MLVELGLFGCPASRREIIDGFLGRTFPAGVGLGKYVGEDLWLGSFEAEAPHQFIAGLEGRPRVTLERAAGNDQKQRTVIEIRESLHAP